MPGPSTYWIDNSGAQLQFKWTLSCSAANVTNLVFETGTGGAAESNNPKERPGGMGTEIVMPALPVYSNLTLTRIFRISDQGTIGSLRNNSGKAQASVTMQPLDNTGAPYGKPRVFTGVVANVDDGAAASNTNTPRMWELVLVVTSVSG